MLALLDENISNATFAIYLPKWSGTIYEQLLAPVSFVEVVIGYVGAAASKSVVLAWGSVVDLSHWVEAQVLNAPRRLKSAAVSRNCRHRPVIRACLFYNAQP